MFSGIETPIMANLAAVNVLPLIHTSQQDSDGHHVDKVSRYFLNQSNAPYLYPRSQINIVIVERAGQGCHDKRQHSRKCRFSHTGPSSNNIQQRTGIKN